MSTNVLNRNNVKVLGEGSQPLVFAHGFGCDQHMWRYVYPAFLKDYKVVLFDYVGAGKSDLDAYNVERYGSLNGYAEDLLEVIHSLDLKNVILAGHSVSCMIGMIAAIREPELFDCLIMVGPSPRYINDTDYVGGFERGEIDELLQTMDKNYAGWANYLAPAVMSNADRPELAEELEASFCATDPVIARQFARATFYSDNRADLHKLRVPSLILQCTDDMIAPVEVGEYMHREMQDSTLLIIEAVGHCPHMSAPAETIHAIQHYLNPVPA